MSNQKICTNWKECSYIIDCPHSRLHESDQCKDKCYLVKGNHRCESINFIRKQKLEKLNQIYEV